ncbi:MAG: secretin N-terminal domain-containing protein [Phycisphaerae bacterium]
MNTNRVHTHNRMNRFTPDGGRRRAPAWLGLCGLLLICSASPPDATPQATARGAQPATSASAPARRVEMPAPAAPSGNESDELRRLRERARASTQPATPLPALTTRRIETPPTTPVRRPSTRPPLVVPGATTHPAGALPVRPALPATGNGPGAPAAPRGAAGSGLSHGLSGGTHATSHPTTTSAPANGQAFQFNYYETPWADVLDDFSRMSGQTIVGDVKGVAGNLSYRDTKMYTQEEALFQLNELLLSRTSKMLLDPRERYLLLGRLADLMRDIPPRRMYNSLADFEGAKLAPHTMCLVLFQPPQGWPAIDVIDQFRPRMDDYYGTQVYGDALILTGMARDHRKFVDIVQQFVRRNPSPPTAELPWRTFKLKNARAADVQGTLRMMYPPTAAAPRPGEDPQAVEAKQINIVADLKSNSVLIKAKAQRVEELARAIDLLDGETRREQPQVAILRVEQAAPDEVANQLRAISQREQQALQDPSRFTPPEEADARRWDIFSTPGSPSLVILGGPQGIDRARQLVKQLDVAESAVRTERILLQFALPLEIVQALQPILVTPGRTPTKTPPVVSADPSGSAILVSGREGQIQQVRDLVAQMDQEPVPNEHEHLMKLSNALPSEISQALVQIVQPVMVPGKGTPRAAPRLVGNDGSGVLLVRCRDDEWQRLERLIRELDGQAPDSTPVLRTLTLQNADAVEIANLLNPMFQGVPTRKGQPPMVVKITADARNNSLRIYATPELAEKIAKMLPEFDVASDVGRVRVIHLADADATEAAAALNSMFGAGLARPGAAPGMSAAQPIKITPEPITNSLLVAASRTDLDQIASIAKEMDEKAGGKKQMRTIVPIRNRPASEVAEALKNWTGSPAAGPAGAARGSKATMKIIASGDQIVLDGPRDQVLPAIELVAALDVVDAGRAVKVYSVSDAEEAAKALQNLLSNAPRPVSTGGGPGRPGAPGPMAGPTQIYPDTYRNVLIVHAQPRDFAAIDKLVEAIEKDPAEAAGATRVAAGDWQVISLKNRDAYNVALDLEDFYDMPGRRGPSTGPEFREGPRKDMLMVKCKPRELEGIQRMATMFDVPETKESSGPDVSVISLKNDVAPEDVLRAIALQYLKKTGQPLHVDTSYLNRDIEVIDIHANEPEPTTRPARTPLSWAPMCPGGLPVRPALLAEALGAAALGQSTTTSAPAEEAPLEVIPMPGNRIIVRGNPEQMKVFKELLEDSKGAQPELKIFKIKYADVNELATKLEAIFNRQRGTPAAAAPATPPNAANPPGTPGGGMPGAPGGAPGSGGPGSGGRGGDRRQSRQAAATAAVTAAPARIQVVPEPRTRQLFITAVPSDFSLITAVLRVMDVETTGIKNIKIFYLVNLEAQATARLLRELFGLDTRTAGPFGGFGGQGGGRRFAAMQGGQPGGQPGQDGQPQGGAPGQPGQPGQPGFVETSAETTTISADDQTNAIVVSGTPDTIRLVGSMIEDLEKQPNNTQPVMKRVELRFARASELATIVKETASSTATGPGGGGGRIGGFPGGGFFGPGGGGARRNTISVNADQRTNSLILAGPAKEVDRVEKIVVELDIDTGSKGSVQIFTVRGDPSTMVTALREMYIKAAAPGATSDVAITPDSTTNTILVRGPEQTRREIAEKIKEMDAKVIDATKLRTIKLTLADADKVATKLTEIFQQRGTRGGKQQVKVTGIASTKSLVVQAPDDLFEEIEKHAQAMDTQSVDLDIRSFKLKHAKAAEVTEKIQALVTQVMTQMRSGAGGSDINLGMFAFTPDPTTNAIIVTGSPVAFVVMQKVVDQLDVQQSELVQREVRSYVLNPNVSAGTIAANIQQLFAGLDAAKTGVAPPSVSAEPVSNIVLVTATKQQHDDIHEKIIKPILAQVSAEPKQFRVPLTSARAEDVANILNNFFNQRKALFGNKPQDTITIVPDPNANLLLVTANDNLKKLFDEQLAALDVPAPGEDQRDTRTYQVKFADPNAVVNAINTAFAPPSGRQPAPRDVVKASADWSTGSIIVTAAREKHEAIAKLVAEVDKTTDATRSTRIVEIVNREAQDVAQALTNIYNQKQRSRTGTPPVTISALQGANKIMVNCNDVEYAEIKELVTQIDQETGAATVHTVTMPEAVKAKDVADAINKIYTGTGFGGRQGLKAEANAATNTLLVYANEKEFERVDREVIQKLSAVPPVGALNLYRRKLKYAVADEVARTLTQFFREKQGIQQGAGFFFDRGGGGERSLEDRIAVTAEAGSNMLIISCTEKTMTTLDELLKEIDTDVSATAGNVLEMFPLKHVNASDALGILEEYLKVSTREREDPQAGLPWWARGPQQQKEEKTVLVGDMRLKAIDATNTIIVVGKPEAMARVREMIAKIDVLSDSPASQPRIIRLTNGNATQIASTLSKAFTDGVRNQPGKTATIVPVILPESVTNSIIVKASPSDYTLIEKMIAELDARMQEEPSDVRIIALPGGTDVATIAKNVAKVINDAEMQRAATLQGYKADKISIEPDVRTSSLLVAASKAKFEQVSQLVESWVRMRAPAGQRATFIKLENSKPEDIKKLIDDMQRQRQGGPRSDARERREPLRSRDGSRGAVASIRGFGPRFGGLAAAFMAAGLAQAQPADRPGRSTIRPRPRPAAVATTTQPGAPVGARRDLSPVRRIGAPTTQDGASLATSIELSGAPLTIQTGPSGLIVIGADEDCKAVETLVRMLDKDLPKPRIEYVELKNAQAKALATSLGDVYDKLEKGKPAGAQPRPEDKVAFIADPRTNGLYVVATHEKMDEVIALVHKSDLTPSIPSGSLKTFRLKNRRVRDVEPNLKNIIQMRLRQKGVTDTSSIGIEKDEQTNSLFVTGGQADLDEVTKVIDQLDTPPPKSEDETTVTFGAADIMVVPLRVATAEKLAAALTRLIQDASQGNTPTKDFIRRLRVLDDQGNPVAELNIDGPTFIVGDPESNSVVAASNRKNLLVLREIIRKFDVEPLRDAVDVTVRTLQFADATEVAEQIKKMLDESKKLTARAAKTDVQPGLPDSSAGSLVYNAVITPDARTNTLVIAGRPEAIKLLDGLITKMDVRGAGLMPFEILTLQYASAASLEQVLDDLMKRRKDALPKGTSANADKSETVILKADPRSEALIVAARADRLAEVKEMVARLDVPATQLIENIRTITLKNGNADDLAKKIDDLWTKRAEQKQSGQVKLEKPAIVADPRSNSLVVAASKGDFEAIRSLVEKLEALPFGPIADIRIVPLRFNSAKDLAPMFKTLFEERAKQREGTDGKTRPTDQVAIAADPVTNALLVACSNENYELLLKKVKELDVEMAAAGVAELFALHNVEASRVKKTLDDIFKDGLFRPGGSASDSATAKERQKLTVAVDDRSNSLIVSAAPENMGIVRKIILQMDDVRTPWNLSNTRLFQLEHADAVKLAAQLADYFKKTEDAAATGGREKTELPVTIISDERTNRLLVGGSKDGIARAEALIRQLDVPEDPTSRILVYRLRDGSASKIGPMLEAIFKDRNQTRGGGQAGGTTVQNFPVTIKVDETSNALVVSASREDHSLMKNIIELLDHRSNILDQVRLFALKKARADAIKKILEELYKGSTAGGGTTGGGSAGGMAVAVTTDERTNAIVVAGPPGEMDNISKLVERLDSAMPIDEAQIGIFPLENADAKKTADLLKEIMQSSGGAGGGTSGGAGANATAMSGQAGSMLISFMKTDPKGMETFFKTIRENVQVSYDERTNAVIVVAPPSSVQLLRNLVKTLDDYKKRDVFVRVFSLRNADAQKSVELLEKIFAQDTQSQASQAEFQQGREIKVEGGASSGAGAPSSGLGGSQQKGTFGRPKTTFTADTRTNSVVVAGWPEDIDVAGDILDQLDAQDVRDRQIYVYSLQNSKAEDVQTSLDSYFQKQEQILESQNQALSESRKAEQKVSVVAHKETNQVILSFSPRYQTQVLDLVRQLDNPPPQVMIQVLLAEVTLDDRFELGLEYALQQLRFSEHAVAGPNGTINGPGFDVVGGTDLGAAASSGGLGGFAFTITGEDFNFLLRSLQSDSKLEVLQRPMIMCQDNQDATINVGQQVPFLRGTQVTDNGQVNSQIEYQDIGVKLAVTPHINPDGFVYMKVKPEISQITPSTINVGNGIVAPIFSKRDAETTVVVKDSETVVIGGLITTSDQETESKVPVLGDVPGLGVLFRTTQRSKTKTELLIVLTPRVVRTVEDARRLSVEARDVTSVLTPEQKASVLMNGLQVTPESESEVSPEDESAPQPLTPTESYRKPSGKPSGKPAGVPVPVRPVDEPGYGPAAPQYGPFAPVSMVSPRRETGGAGRPGQRPMVIPALTTPAAPRPAPQPGVEVIDLTGPGG